MRIIVYVTDTVDWANATMESLKSQEPFFRAAVLRWNECLDMPYFKFRDELRKICVRNWGKMSDYVFTSSIDTLKTHIDAYDDYDFVIPCDEDWLNPDVRQLLEVQKVRDMVCWKPLMFQTTGQTPGTFVWKKDEPVPSTFAIKVSTLKKLTPEEIKDLFSKHKKSAVDFGFDIYETEDVHTCRVHHPGKAGVMQRMVREDLRGHFETLRSFNSKRLYRVPHHKWIDPYVASFFGVLKKTILRII
jgi:hypothetical protein